VLSHRRDGGASAVEYALIIAAVALLLIPVARSLQGVLEEVLQNSCESTATQNLGDPDDC